METDLTILDQVHTIAQAIYDKKGMNTLILDVRGISTLTDYIIIADGLVDRHVVAIAQSVEKTMQDKGVRPYRVEGMQEGDWVVVDYYNVMVHLFMPGVREKYQLESLWSEAKLVETEFVAVQS